MLIKGILVSVVVLLVALIAVPLIGYIFLIFFREDLFEYLVPIGTILIYTSMANLGWFAGAPARIRSIFLAVLFPLIFGVGLPALLNAGLRFTVDQMEREDAKIKTPVREPQIVGLLVPPAYDRSGKSNLETDCALICQRLLFWGGRKAVLAGAAPTGGDPEAAVNLIRYWVEEKGGCPNTRVAKAGALGKEPHVFGTYPTSATTEQLIAGGRCLNSAPGDIAEADTVMVESAFNTDALLAAGRVGGGVASAEQVLFQKQGKVWRPVVRLRAQRFTTARIPLWFDKWAYPISPQGVEVVQSIRDGGIQEELRPWLGK